MLGDSEAAMLGVGEAKRGITTRGGARGAGTLLRIAPLLPLAAYLLAASSAGDLRLGLTLAVGAGALLGSIAVHLLLAWLWRPVEAAAELLEARLDPAIARCSDAPSLGARLSRVASLAADRIDALAGRIERSALADELTGLPNRRAMLPQIKAALARARRSGEPFAIALVDLDGLKQVNEVLGVEFGDAVLRDFADLLRSEIRASDIAGRWSGADFLLLLSLTPVDAAVGVVERLRQRLLERQLAVIEGGAVTVSAGVAGFRITDLHVEEIIKRADEALEDAKRAGRNCVLALDAERYHEI